MSKVDRIKNAIQAWDQVRSNATQVNALLEAGHHFEMLPVDEQTLSPFVNEKLYVDMGVENGKIIFILVPDSLEKTAWDDMTSAELDAILIKSYQTGYDISDPDFLSNQVDGPDVTVLDALSRHFAWASMHTSFLNTEVNHPKGLFECFVMPYKHMKAFLKDSDTEKLLFVFGLKKDADNVSESGYCADFIAWPVMLNSTRGDGNPINLYKPSPPYGK